MKQIEKLERNILEQLSASSGGLHAFTLYGRIKVGFSAFTQAILSLQKAQYISEESNYIKITSQGRMAVTLLSKERTDKHWRRIPDFMLRPIITPEDFYVPRRSLLDKKAFKTVSDDLD